MLGATQLATIDGPLTNDTITYDYDELGRVSARVLAGQQTTQTYDSYDSLGRVTSVVSPFGTFAYTYDGVTFRVSSITLPNGQTNEYTYFDNVGDRRVQTIRSKNAGGTPLLTFNYTYNALGNLMSARVDRSSEAAINWTYTYDNADQLVTATKWDTIRSQEF